MKKTITVEELELEWRRKRLAEVRMKNWPGQTKNDNNTETQNTQLGENHDN